MPSTVLSSSFVSVPSIVVNSGITNSGPSDPQNITSAPAGTKIIFRVSAILTVPASATGQSVTASFQAVDSRGNTSILEVPAAVPGTTTNLIGLLELAGGQSLSFSAAALPSETIVSLYDLHYIVESLQ